jgi:hypothetical protein
LNPLGRYVKFQHVSQLHVLLLTQALPGALRFTLNQHSSRLLRSTLGIEFASSHCTPSGARSTMLKCISAFGFASESVSDCGHCEKNDGRLEG